MITADDIESFIEAHNRQNDDFRKRLLDNQIPLDQTRPVELHFWSGEQQHAALLARDLYQSGFLILMLAPSDEDDGNVRWSVQAGIQQPISRILSEEFTRMMVRLAAEHESEFDGWGASF